MINAIALPATVADLVREYEEKDASIEQAIAAFDQSFDAVNMAATVAGTFVEPIGSKPHLYAETLRNNLLKSGWKAVFNRLNVGALATAKDKKLFELTLAAPPPLTFDNALATFRDYFDRPRFHILRGLAEAFCALDPAYRSHAKVRIGVKGLPKRIIMKAWGSFYSDYSRQQFRDIANALAAYQGKAPIEWAEVLEIDDAHRRGEDAVLDGSFVIRKKGENPVNAPARGLTVRLFANGNAHVFFDKQALLDINRALAEFYGEVLPDAEEEGVKPSASTAVAKDLQFYWSPPAVVAAALDFAGIDPLDRWNRQQPKYRVLEPSCGDGRILDELRARGCPGIGVEYHPGRAREAQEKGHGVVCGNFLEQPPTADFDKVVMNPPFYGRHYVKHVEHALKFLKPGGTLVAILPASAHYDHGVLKGEWRDLPVGSFSDAGTNVPTGMLRIVKGSA